MAHSRIPWRAAIITILILTSCNLPTGAKQTPLPVIDTPSSQNGPQSPSAAVPSVVPTPTPTAEARIITGDMALLQGETEKARSEYLIGSAETQDIDLQAAAMLGIGRSYLLDREYDQAVESLNGLIYEHPENRWLPNAYYYLAQAHLAREEYSQAAEALAKYVELNPGIIDDVIQQERGDVLQLAGDYTGAIAAYEAGIAASSGNTGSIRIKIGQAYAALGDHSNAVPIFLDLLETGDNDSQKAQANLLAGQSYMALGFPEQAYARYQDSITRFPTAYESYSGLVALVNEGVPVSDLDRGIVDFYAGQYGYANEALLRFLNTNSAHDATPHHLRALSLRALDQPYEAITEWQAVINDHPEDELWLQAWNEIAYTEWAWLDQFDQGAETLMALVALQPTSPNAADALFNAGRILERGGRLTRAAQTWERLIDEYPTANITPRGYLLAGVTYYRLTNYEQALTIFQRSAVLGTNPADQAAGLFWVGKTQKALGDSEAARQTWQQAAELDPTGYYSVRAGELALSQPVLHDPVQYSLGVDTEGERLEAEDWLLRTFNLPVETDFDSLDALGSDTNFKRGQAFWELGKYQKGRDDFEALRLKLEQDPLNSYRLMNHLLSIGAYRPAIFTSRQILTLAGLDDNQTLGAPKYFNHVRFGVYYRELVVQEANRYQFNPLLILSLMRQESFFEGFVSSGANAVGLMQILPTTGQELVLRYSWPPDYQTADLLKPSVNIRLGTTYLFEQNAYFGSLYVALAAYNGGPGNANIWNELSGGDPDLFLEVIRFDETRRYITHIAEFMNLYRLLYGQP